jgi:hypothetical protein
LKFKDQFIFLLIQRFYEPTNKITNDCLNNSYLKNKLNANEWINIRKANTDGYVDFDIPLIYKLLRNLNVKMINL